jgi:hypothetical protein
MHLQAAKKQRRGYVQDQIGLARKIFLDADSAL